LANLAGFVIYCANFMLKSLAGSAIEFSDTIA